MPKVFRTVFTALIVGPLALRLGLISGMMFIADYEKVYRSFQVWRLVSPCFIAGVNFMWAMNLFMFYQYGLRVSEGSFSNKPADEAFMYIMIIALSNLVGWIFNQQVYYFILIF